MLRAIKVGIKVSALITINNHYKIGTVGGLKCLLQM